MKIGIDIRAFNNGSTGIHNYVKSILDVLQSIDHTNTYELYEFRPVHYTIKNPRWRIQVCRTHFPGLFWFHFLLPIKLKSDNVDIFWATENMQPLLLNRRIKCITTVFDSVFFKYPSTMDVRTLLTYKAFIPLSIRLSNQIVTISQTVLKEIQSKYPSLLSPRVTYVYCGAPCWKTPLDYTAQSRGDHLFFAGNLEPRKNLLGVLKALAILKRHDGLIVRLRLAGPAGWKNKAFTDFLNNSIVRDQIELLGFLDVNSLQTEYLSCKALIYPSVYEGFGIPVLEALSLDCLVLTSKGTVMEEVAGNSALFFDPCDPGDIAATIRRIYDFSFQRNNYLADKNKVLKKFSWLNAGQKMQSIFQQFSE